MTNSRVCVLLILAISSLVVVMGYQTNKSTNELLQPPINSSTPADNVWPDRNEPLKHIYDPCGNGRLDSGEECDERGPGRCCTANCKLRRTTRQWPMGVQCSPRNDRNCTVHCQWRQTGPRSTLITIGNNVTNASTIILNKDVSDKHQIRTAQGHKGLDVTLVAICCSLALVIGAVIGGIVTCVYFLPNRTRLNTDQVERSRAGTGTSYSSLPSTIPSNNTSISNFHNFS